MVDPQSGNTSISWSLISGTPQIVDTGDDDDDDDNDDDDDDDQVDLSTVHVALHLSFQNNFPIAIIKMCSLRVVIFVVIDIGVILIAVLVVATSELIELSIGN